MKKILSVVAVVLVLATCLSVCVSAADKIKITSAKSDTVYVNLKDGVNVAGADSAVSNLRPATGLWCNLSTAYEPAEDSIAAPGERYADFGFEQSADIEEIKIQWYQGGGSVTDIKAEKNRKYIFRIEATADGKSFTQIYPTSGNANSGTGSDFESYKCSFKDAKAIRLWGYGNNVAGEEVNFAFRNIEVYGTGKGGSGADVGGNDTPAQPSGDNGGNGGNKSPATGDFENLAIFGAVALVSCAAVVIIRKKIRER